MAGAAGIGIVGEVRIVSPGVVEPAPKAELGTESLNVVLVTHRGGLPVAGVFVVVQPAGKAGAVTPSKFSVKAGAPVCKTPSV